MTGKIKGKLFLTNSEREEILNLADALMDVDYEDEVEQGIGQRWIKILYSLVFGKQLQGSQHFPIVLVRNKDESTD